MNNYNFIQSKNFDTESFLKYLKPAISSNQFTNNGHAVKLLEQRARQMLQITDNKAVVATCNGSVALHAIIQTLTKHLGNLNIATQAFNFPSAIQGPASNSRLLDFDNELDIDTSDLTNIDVIIPTNCFGHLQNIEKIQNSEKIVIYDNAATPYSFWKGFNSCNYGIASFISLHHTKPIGFGEGGLIIIDRYYEDTVRSIISFDKQPDGSFTRYGNNYKMSEIAAASIMQWWDQFDINTLASKYSTRYKEVLKSLKDNTRSFIHKAPANEIFFPNCLPIIYTEEVIENKNALKYYKPLDASEVANEIYENIVCLPLAD